MSDDLRLTPSMKRHIAELAALGPGSGWGPETAGEWRCADGLERRGLLRRNLSGGGRPYAITAAGYEVGTALNAEATTGDST